jgi:VanZ family protein
MAMFVGTHIPNPEAIIGPEVSDKLLHFLAYFVLMALLATRERLLVSRWPTFRRMTTCLLVVSGYAIADELLQAVPGINRHADVQDALADVAGAATAAAMVLVCRFWLARNRPDDSTVTANASSQNSAI